MRGEVRFLPEKRIIADAEALLAAYERECGQALRPPIPVDEILETHLGLSLDFDDLLRVLGAEDVLGALWVSNRAVFIDERLDPHEYPDEEGRYNFTVGHEIGHWEEHRHYFLEDEKQGLLLPNPNPDPSIVCRTSQSKTRIEWQADTFAANLLMPKAMIFQAWKERFGRLEPFWLDVPTRTRKLIVPEDIVTRKTFNRVAEEFAPIFRVSIQAMRIRLEELGLLLKDRPSDTLPFRPAC
jgi:hypothetical protein